MSTLNQLGCIKLLESDSNDTYIVTIKNHFQINSVHFFNSIYQRILERNAATQRLSIAIIIRNVS